MPRFDNHRVLITGAGAGIGRLMAEKFAARGAEVIVTARRIAAAREVVGHITNAGGRAHAYTLDVSKIASISTFRDRLHAEHGPVSILVNNAGVVFGGEFEQVPLQRHLDTFKVNSEGLMACTHAFLDDLIQSPRGHLVNIASASAFIGLPYGGSYAASKWAVVGFSESLRLELKERHLDHVKVTTFAPVTSPPACSRASKRPCSLPC